MYLGYTFGKSLQLVADCIFFVLDNSTHFFIYCVDSQGKYDENYSGHLF